VYLIDNEELKIIKTYGDGRCLFRCVVITLSRDLLICHRNKFGIGDREEEEKQCADSLRSHVVNFLRQEEHCLIDAVKDLPLLLDNRLTAPYLSIDDRLQRMSKCDEYGGSLEIAAMSLMMKMPFELYQLKGSALHLHTRLPSCGYKNREPIRILYSIDESGCPGHYDVIIGRSYEPTHQSTDIVQIVTKIASTAEAEDGLIGLLDILDPSRAQLPSSGINV
jgi:hypothetical protein